MQAAPLKATWLEPYKDKVVLVHMWFGPCRRVTLLSPVTSTDYDTAADVTETSSYFSAQGYLSRWGLSEMGKSGDRLSHGL